MPIDPGDAARQKLLAIEKRKQAAVIIQFGRIRDRLSEDLADLLKRIDIIQRNEGNAPPELLFKKARVYELLEGVKTDIQNAAARLAAITQTGQDQAIDVAQDQAGATPGITGDLGAFDSQATRSIVGSAIEGGPLVKTFERIAPAVRDVMFEKLFYGVATGAPNAAIAAEVRDAIGGGTARAMTIVRTETNRAYREASRMFYDDEPGVVGWRWLAALDLRTCPICWALHGRIFKTSTKFGTHPNCRCTMVPVFKGDPAAKTGPEAFADLSEAQQKAILGPRRFELYGQGANLSDFVGQVRTPFGIGRRVKPIADTKFVPNPRGPGNPPFAGKGGGVPVAPKRSF